MRVSGTVFEVMFTVPGVGVISGNWVRQLTTLFLLLSSSL